MSTRETTKLSDDELGLALPPRWQRGAHALVLGHRGARHAAPENTLEAFELSRQEGASGTELDVQLSRDGVPFVVHDLDLARVTGSADVRQVAELDAAELDRVMLLGQVRVPRLAAVLDWAAAHDQLLNIELKTACSRKDPVAARVAELLGQYPTAAEWTLVSSFHPLLLGRFRICAPRIATGLLLSARHTGVMKPGWLELLGCQAIHPEAVALLTPRPERPLPQGLAFNTWTVNDPERAAELDALGVNAIISDRPGAILQRLGA